MFDIFLQIPRWQATCLFFFYGSLFGSFANVLIYRMQKEGPLNLFSRSRCPHCSYNIPFYLNIPILSWFLLRGCCQNCKAKIFFRYPVVEFLMAFLFSALFLAIGWKWFLLEALLFTFALLVASVIDLDQMILPDSLTLSGIVLALLGSIFNPDRFFLDSLLGAFLGAFILISISFVYYLVRKQEGMGGGDIKMLAWMGALLGWKPLSFILLFSSLLGTFVGLFLILRDKKTNDFQKALPFGPYLAIAALFYILCKDFIPSSLFLFAS